MVNKLITKLEKVSRESSDPQVRSASARDAEGYRAALDKKTGLFLQYGDKRHPVASAKEAGEVWNMIALEAICQGLGPDDMRGTPLLVDADSKYLGHLSWNGRAWKRVNGKDVPFDAEADASLKVLLESQDSKDA